MCPFLFPNQTRRFKYFSGFQVPRWCCSASLLNSPTPPALSAPRCHSSSLPHHSAPACFSLPIRHTPLIKPTPLTCALCSSTLTHWQIVLDACTRLSSVPLPDLPVLTMLASDCPALPISWKSPQPSVPDHNPHLSLSGFCLPAPLAIW